MSHPFRIFQAPLLLAFLSLPATADMLTYQVVVNTSGQNQNYGYIDLELNGGPGGTPAPVMASVFNFSGAVLNPSDPNNDEIGPAMGSLPNSLTINNSNANDYFEGLTFGSRATFDVTLSGSGVSASGGVNATSGTVFTVFFYDSSQANTLFTADPSTGAADLINIGPTGVPSTVGAVTSVPEPGTSLLMLSAALTCAAWSAAAAKNSTPLAQNGLFPALRPAFRISPVDRCHRRRR